ncbi:MAG TPA: hypothetical protein VG992_02830 [Candidatus Saccharimonadales bacterium]|nr:hypothetical protein [Candidatus Saccharimonadales bacterium]
MLNATRPTHKFIEKLAANASEAANPDMPFGVFVEPSDELQLIGLCKVDLGNGSALPGSGVKVGHFQGVPELGDPSKNFSRGHLDLLCRCLDWQRVVGIELK